MNGVVFQLLRVTAFVFVPKSAFSALPEIPKLFFFQPYLEFQHSSSFLAPFQFPCLFILNFLNQNET